MWPLIKMVFARFDDLQMANAALIWTKSKQKEQYIYNTQANEPKWQSVRFDLCLVRSRDRLIGSLRLPQVIANIQMKTSSAFELR